MDAAKEWRVARDKVQKILNTVSESEQDVYATCEGRMLRKDVELKSCGVRSGSTVQVTRRTQGRGEHKDKKNKAEKKRSASPVKLEQTREEKTEVEPELHEDSQEVRLDDRMCALVCEQMRSITASACESQVTSEEMQRIVEQVGRLRMALADVRKRATNVDLQRTQRMEECLKKLEEETRTRQEEVRARCTDEQGGDDEA